MVELIAAIPVSELPPREPVRVPPEARLRDVIDTLKARRQGAAFVVDGDALVGVFSERDLMTRIDHSILAWLDTPVSAVMTRQPLTVIGDDAPLAEALRLMVDGRMRHLPVVRDGALVGVVSVRDVLAHLARRFPAEFINLPPDPDHEATAPYGG